MRTPRDPVVDAMLACDHVHLDPGTGKYTLLGVDVSDRPLPALGRNLLRLRANGRHVQDYAIPTRELTRG